MNDTFHVGGPIERVENSVSDFSFIKEGGGVHSRNESIIISFPLSFFEILEPLSS